MWSKTDKSIVLFKKNSQISPSDSNLGKFNNVLRPGNIAVFHIMTRYRAGYKFIYIALQIFPYAVLKT
jgi:hypothetical protein